MALLVSCSGCTTVTLSRTVLSPLPITPTAQVAPSEWATVWAGAQVAPAAARDRTATTAVMMPSVMPELGALFLTAAKHLVVGASVHMTHSNWARAAHDAQPAMRDGTLVGARARIGVRFELGDPMFLLLGTLEPGFDVLPWSTNFSPTPGIAVLPQISGSLTPAIEVGRVRAYVGVSAGSMLQLDSVVTFDTLCLSCDGAPGPKYGGLGTLLAGFKVSLHENIALSGSVTVPLTRMNPTLMPMFSVALMYQTPRTAPEPERGYVPSETLEDPPLVPAPEVEPAQL